MVIRKLIIESAEIEKLASFYGSLLELPVERKSNGIRIKAGESLLEIDAATKTYHPFYHFAFNIPSNKIEEAREWLKTKVELIWMEAYKSDIADFVNWHAKSVYFFDPAGNIVEFISRFDLNNATSDRFNSKQILTISEVGLVFRGDELELQTNELISRYGLSYFDKQPPLDQFKALGDDEGLFIIVPGNRNWFATEKPSGIFPLTVEFMNQGVTHVFK